MTYHTSASFGSVTPPPTSHHPTASVACIREHNVHPLVKGPSEENVHAFEDILLPPPSALTSGSTHYGSEGPQILDQHPSSNTFERSLAGSILDRCNKLPPLISRQDTSRGSSPTRSLASYITLRAPQTPPESPDRKAKRDSHPVFGTWFSGTSAPVNFGILPSPSRREEEYDEDIEEYEMEDPYTRSPGRRTRGNSVATKASTPVPSTSKFSWFGGKSSTATPPQPSFPLHLDSNDPLLNLNIQSELFPHGPTDPLAPSSYNDLLTNAENLIQRLHSAYRMKCEILSDMEQEHDVQEEELEESETRARHLKIQLDDMSAQAVEQDKAMEELVIELAAERQRRREDEEARKRSVALVRSPDSYRSVNDVTPRRNKRDSESDSGFESDADSVFSRPQSSRFQSEAESSIHQNDLDTNSPYTSQNQTSTYDSVSTRNNGCGNCQGVSQGSAWAMVSRVEMQNQMLKSRVSELEDSVESCLDLISGPWGVRA